VTGPVAAAIANAVFDAIGGRMRDLPSTRKRMPMSINDA
jgi:CO/xanthine dehydrogenase Mo-binding subunit